MNHSAKIYIIFQWKICLMEINVTKLFLPAINRYVLLIYVFIVSIMASIRLSFA